jgi:hypothetical protein
MAPTLPVKFRLEAIREPRLFSVVRRVALWAPRAPAPPHGHANSPSQLGRIAFTDPAATIAPHTRHGGSIHQSGLPRIQACINALRPCPPCCATSAPSALTCSLHRSNFVSNLGLLRIMQSRFSGPGGIDLQSSARQAIVDKPKAKATIRNLISPSQRVVRQPTPLLKLITSLQSWRAST